MESNQKNNVAIKQLSVYASIQEMKREYNSLVKVAIAASGIISATLTFTVMTVLNLVH